MPITAKKYKCKRCGFIEAQNTNHYGETYSFGHFNTCPKCPPWAKYPEFGGNTVWECMEMPTEEMSIYKQMLAAGVTCLNHESDLYVPVNDTTKAIVDTYRFKSNVSTFQNQVEGGLWYDIPLAFEPFWEQKQKGGL